MRTVTYGGACSLDGFITGPNESIDWLVWSDDVAGIVGEYWKSIDTLIMGRKTWEFAQKAGGNGGAPMEGISSYVFSRTLEAIDAPGVTLVSQDAADFVRKLKKATGKGICVFGGGDFARTLFEADLIDEVGFNVHPVLLGSGTPGLLAGGRVNLELKECRPLAKGCIHVLYRVKHRRGRREEGGGRKKTGGL
jgi:dihydrofolate reductase